MTRKQLEEIILFMCLVTNPGVNVNVINKQFGTALTDDMANEEAITHFLEVKDIKLEDK